jgi:hypothetical protein
VALLVRRGVGELSRGPRDPDPLVAILAVPLARTGVVALVGVGGVALDVRPVVVRELVAFTGVKDRHDQVDALAAAFDSGETPSWIAVIEAGRAAQEAEAAKATASRCRCPSSLAVLNGICQGCGWNRTAPRA